MEDMPIANALKAKYPIGAAIASLLGKGIIEVLKGQPPGRPTTEVVREIIPRLEEVARNNPESINNFNLEKPLESRTTVWAAGTVLIGLATLGTMLKNAWNTGELNVEAFSVAVGSIVTGLAVIRGRWANGLEPLRWTKVFTPWRWFKTGT